MANTLAGNVYKVDTSGSIPGARNITSIKYIGASTGTAVITDNDSTNRVWEESGTSNVFNSKTHIRTPSGVTVTLTNSAVVYLYID